LSYCLGPFDDCTVDRAADVVSLFALAGAGTTIRRSTMKRLVPRIRRVMIASAAIGFLISAAPVAAYAPTAPTGEAGACNMQNTGAMHGMGTAFVQANPNGVNGMIVAIEQTTPYGPPDFCPNP
jgi:hypothetical protein